MIKITCYQTTQDQLVKTFCQLAEKCFYSGLKICVLTENDNLTKDFDLALWTYSKKHFIPHATHLDPLPERQAVYITNSIEKLPKKDILIFVNASESTILKILSEHNKENLNNLQKILFLFDDSQKIQSLAIKNIINKSSIKKFEIGFFIKNKLGKWEDNLCNL